MESSEEKLVKIEKFVNSLGVKISKEDIDKVEAKIKKIEEEYLKSQEIK